MTIRFPVIAMGASTGGVEALQHVLNYFPANCPPTLIVQHMKGDFLARLASRLCTSTKAKVVAATDGMRLEPGHIYVATNPEAHLAVPEARTPMVRLISGGMRSGHRPSVDELFSSLTWLGPRVSAAILTGMGSDGAEGLLALRRAGARTLAQSEDTCVVYGMPRAAVELGAARRQVPLDHIGVSLLNAQ